MLLYLLAVICPPLGILVHGKICHAAVNALVWAYAIVTPDLTGILMWIIASSHGAYIIRHGRMVRSLDSDISF